jgi:hypothetical protein
MCSLICQQVTDRTHIRRNLTLRVADNGAGIYPAITDQGQQGHFGLQGMRERAARIGGTFALTSSSDAGTEIRLVVPGKIIFQTQKPIRQPLLAKLRNFVLRTFKKPNWTKAEFRWHTYAVSGIARSDRRSKALTSVRHNMAEQSSLPKDSCFQLWRCTQKPAE